MSDLRGLGIDLCEIARMQRVTSRTHFMERCFTEAERSYAASRGAGEAQSLAAMFAAKEALLKALGTGITIPLTDIEILHRETGQPYYSLHGKAASLVGSGSVMLSLTHEAGVAAAVCLWMN